MREEPFEVAITGGVLRGHVGGDGPPALLLHGGAAVPDYLDGLAAELAPFFTTYRYTQRGTLPSTGDPPYGIEAHVEDAAGILDAFEIPRAWAVGHSWGGHLALHLAVAHPERLLGLVCIDPIGAYSDVFADLDPTLRRGLTRDTSSTASSIPSQPCRRPERRRSSRARASRSSRAAAISPWLECPGEVARATASILG